jgi:hypothetical protein
LAKALLAFVFELSDERPFARKKGVFLRLSSVVA